MKKIYTIDDKLFEKLECFKCGSKNNLSRVNFLAQRTRTKGIPFSYKFSYQVTETKTYEMPVCSTCQQEFEDYEPFRKANKVAKWAGAICIIFIVLCFIPYPLFGGWIHPVTGRYQFTRWVGWYIFGAVLSGFISGLAIRKRIKLSKSKGKISNPNKYRKFISEYMILLVKPEGSSEWISRSRWIIRILNKDKVEFNQQVLEEINKKIQTNSNDHFLFFTKTGVLLNLEKYDEALENINKALKLHPHDRTYARLKASILFELEKELEATNFIRKERKYHKLGKNEDL